MKKKTTKQFIRYVVAQGRSKSRRIRNVDGHLIPEQCSCSGERAKQALSPSKQTAVGLWSCHRDQAVKGAGAVNQATRG